MRNSHPDYLLVAGIGAAGSAQKVSGYPAPGSQAGESIMVFTKRLREGIRRGRIRCSIRIWTRAHVKVGGRYPMDDGSIVVDSVTPITRREITHDLARESGFDSVEDLLQIARHGKGDNIYLIRFHYLPPGGWDRSSS